MELESLVLTKFVLLGFCHVITVIKTKENVCVRIDLTSHERSSTSSENYETQGQHLAAVEAPIKRSVSASSETSFW